VTCLRSSDIEHSEVTREASHAEHAEVELHRGDRHVARPDRSGVDDGGGLHTEKPGHHIANLEPFAGGARHGPDAEGPHHIAGFDRRHVAPHRCDPPLHPGIDGDQLNVDFYLLIGQHGCWLVCHGPRVVTWDVGGVVVEADLRRR
jgi:hypothetical protein